MLNTLKNYPGFVHHGHPGYTTVQNIANGTLIGEEYAKEINRSKIFLTCNSVYEYTLMKYFEVMACKSLLLAPESKETADLGMINGVHFVAVDRYNFLEKAQYYLANDEEREHIINNGYQLVMAVHTTQMRAQELISHIEKIIEKNV
ncbi:glycosyltransferase [Fictibacillus enclensis]|nr:glycosyltransferase [Fictibacillus enclensis]